MKRLLQLFILLALTMPAAAQQFPSKPINMIVVFAPGGATDVLARIAADHMSRTLGQRVLVENVTRRRRHARWRARRAGRARRPHADGRQHGQPFRRADDLCAAASNTIRSSSSRSG